MTRRYLSALLLAFRLIFTDISLFWGRILNGFCEAHKSTGVRTAMPGIERGQYNLEWTPSIKIARV